LCAIFFKQRKNKSRRRTSVWWPIEIDARFFRDVEEEVILIPPPLLLIFLNWWESPKKRMRV
jgi:hypothetical protein